MEDGAQSASDASDDVPYRRRGRPLGKNRVPLSLKERRARNAQYERERRFETSEAMADLAKAAECDPTFSNSDILATVIDQLQRASNIDSSREIADLKRTNEKLIRQVEALEQRLSNWEESNQCSHEDVEDPSIAGKRKRKSTKGQNKKNIRTTVHMPTKS